MLVKFSMNLIDVIELRELLLRTVPLFAAAHKCYTSEDGLMRTVIS